MPSKTSTTVTHKKKKVHYKEKSCHLMKLDYLKIHYQKVVKSNRQHGQTI